MKAAYHQLCLSSWNWSSKEGWTDGRVKQAQDFHSEDHCSCPV